ncbi:Hypothetical protein A7982_11510 [Minicystis rosea]|nr:Hypothetical protein A7982_11510 [Minicystis rosea]
MMRAAHLTDRSRFLATLVDYAGACSSLAEFRLQILTDLSRSAGCDGALFRPGERWAGARPLYVNDDSRFTDIYVSNASRFGPELRRWCELSRGRRAFIDNEVHSDAQQQRMATYREMMHPERIRSILACPLVEGGSTVGLIFLFRRGQGSAFPGDTALAATRLLSALAIADRIVDMAFRRGRPLPRDARPAAPEGGFESLGAREQQVAMLIAHGMQNKEIAELLGSSPNTVHTQARRVFDKLGLHGRTQVALLTKEIGLLGRATPTEDPMLSSFGALLCRRLARRFGDHALPAEGISDPPAEPEQGLSALGTRERQVAELVLGGLTSREIARHMGTSFHTVRTQTQRIYQKLGVRGRTELAVLLSGTERAERAGGRSSDHPFE